jgi:chaperone LolA
MRVPLVFLLVILFLTGGDSLAAAESVSLEEILEASADRYNEIEGFSSRFTQRVEFPVLGKTKDFSGMLRYKKPNRLLLDYDDPEDAYILCDGESFYVYLPDVDSTGVMKTRLGSDPRSFLTEFFLDEAREKYTASLVGEEGDAYRLRFVPRGGGSEFVRLDMWVGRRSRLVERISSVDPGGNVTTYALEGVTPAPQPDEYFRFTLPKGKNLIDLGQK